MTSNTRTRHDSLLRVAARLRLLTFALIATIGCGGGETDTDEEPLLYTPRDGEVPSCPAAEDPEEVRAEFAARLFPDSAVDDAMFCALNFDSNVCTPQGLHMSGVLPFAGAAPTEAACRASAGATLVKCDNYAKHLITSALDTGDMIKLLRGVTRMRDVMARPSVPAYYKASSPANRFAKWTASTGVSLAGLAKCTTGTDAAGYFCLATDPAAPKRGTVRGLLELLERHNGVLVRKGALAGARSRQASIVASMTGPLNARLAQQNKFAPVSGPGVQRVQALAKVFALRLLDGTAESSPETELEAFLELPGYVAPGGPSELYTAGMGLVAAQLGAYGWDSKTEDPITLDLRAAADLREFFATLKATAKTAEGLGSCELVDELAALYVRAGSSSLMGARLATNVFLPDLVSNSNTITTMSLFGLWDEANHQYILDCNMHQELVGLTTTWNHDVVVDSDDYTCVENAQWVDAWGNTGEIVDCYCSQREYDPLGGFGGDCLEWTMDVAYDDYSVEWQDYEAVPAANTVVEELFATTIVKDAVYESYNDLISSDDNRNGVSDPLLEKYNNTTNPLADLHHLEAEGAYVSILQSSVGWVECSDELRTSSVDYSMAETATVTCPAGLDLVDGACVSAQTAIPGGGAPTKYIPYAIAVRICPEYVAKVNGVTDSSLELDSCATPWRFTQSVQYFLDHDWVTADAIEQQPEAGQEVKPLAIDFAAEAIHLTQPVAALYRHRADFASVTGGVPGASSDPASTWYTDHAGLAKVDLELAGGEVIMAEGLDLFMDFEKLEIWGESARNIIARKSGDAYEGCLGECDDNGRMHARALLYRRLRDSVETYNRLATSRVETQRRRLDDPHRVDTDPQDGGGYDAIESCLVGTDEEEPFDQIPDTLACDDTISITGEIAGYCVEQCGYFEAAVDTVTQGGARMTALGEILDAHGNRASLFPEQQEFVDATAAFATGTATELDLAYQAMLAGEDWLGYRPGLWYPGVSVDFDAGYFDVTDRIDELFTEIEAVASSTTYEALISSYLTGISNLLDWEARVRENNRDVADSIAALCSGGPDACDSEWRTTYPQVDEVNAAIATAVCDRTLTFYYYDDTEEDGVGSSTMTIGPTGEDCAEPLVSPDFAVLEAQQSGSAKTQAAQMQVTLAELLIAAQDVDAYITLIDRNNRERMEMGILLDDADDAANRRENILDAMVCGVAVAGAVVTTVGVAACTAGTDGACAPAAPVIAKAWAAAATTCATAFNDSSILSPKAPTQKEVERAFSELTMTLQTNEEAYTLATKMSGLTVIIARYQVEVNELLSILAAIDRTAAYANEELDDLVDSMLFNPSQQLFEEESLGAMKSEFEEFTRLARDVHHLIQYDVGQTIREGGVFQIAESGPGYYFPRLAEITIFKQHSQGIDAAFGDLESDGGSALVKGERGLNLLAYVSLLQEVHYEFTQLYQDRQPSGAVFIGSATPGLPGVDWNEDGVVDAVDAEIGYNPGDAAMLGDSPFFDPLGYEDIVPNGGTACASGEIDLRDYCTQWVGGGAVTPQTCFAVENLSVLERYSLAYMDHMTRGPGVRTFACHHSFQDPCAEVNESGICVPGELFEPYVTVADAGADKVFRYNELGGVAGANYVYTDPGYFAAQTRVVQNILRRFEDERATHDPLDADHLEVRPGTYLWLVNMSASGEERGFSSASFDPEADLLYNQTISDSSIAEHLTSMAMVCTDQIACAALGDDFFFDITFLAGGYLGDRCKHTETLRQERVAFSMDPDTQVGLPVRHIFAQDDVNEQTALILAEPGIRDAMAAQPLHGNSWIVAVRGHASESGQPIYPGLNLYAHTVGSSPEGPRIRLAMNYTYYDGHFQEGDFEYNVAGLLECNGGPDGSLCVNGECGD